MLRIHTDFFVPKYQQGHWNWNEEQDELNFCSSYEKMKASENFIKLDGFKFLNSLDQVQESIYRQEFQREDTTFDADVILIQDIVNLVMFSAPSEILTSRFVHFINLNAINRFLRYLVIYFEYFLRVVEFLLIRRDQISGLMPKMQSAESVKIKRIYSSHLTQYRLLVAREYSNILLGIGHFEPYHHYNSDLRISKTRRDRFFHESFLAFCTQVIWIAMHRRALDVIKMELGRLFRSEHFLLQTTDTIIFTEEERKVLYGRNYLRVNYRAQNSPLIQEIQTVSRVNLPILWIGNRKYRGTDLRVHELEMEYLVPSSQLVLINKVHGILGHPKKLYTTLLKLDWNEVRKQNYSENYDPYNIVTQPHIQIPNINEEILRKNAKQFTSFYNIQKSYEPWDKTTIEKWINRDENYKQYKNENLLNTASNICLRILEEEIVDTNVDKITQKFKERVHKLYKQPTK